MGDNVDSFKQHFDDFLNFTEEYRTSAQLRRDFRDLKQWTEEEQNKLQSRGQASVVIDYFSKKVDSLVGVEVSQRTDPKAYPITPKHTEAAEAITDALRYVEEKESLDEIFTDVFEDKVVEGYGGVIVETKVKKNGVVEVDVSRIPWDRIYYDPHSSRCDFKDASYIGQTVWMHVSEATEMFPDFSEDDFIGSNNDGESSQFDDKPSNWINKTSKRVRINHEFYLSKGVWNEVFYSGETVLVKPKPSRFLSEDGEPSCPIELESDYIDRENNRYGWMQRLVDPQIEINHRRSKALHMLSSAQVIAEKGAIDDDGTGDSIYSTLQELKKAESFINVNPGKLFQVDRNIEMGTAQMQFYQEAKSEIDRVGISPEVVGGGEQAISGRAFIAKQQGGMLELKKIYAKHSHFKKRVYRQVWARIKQFWDEERWIRVTDDSNAMRWVGINVPVTMAHKLVMDQTDLSFEEIQSKFEPLVQQSIQQAPELGQVVDTINQVPELDMDIIVEDAPDTLTIQQEQFEVLSRLFQFNPTPEMFEMLIKLSSMRNKDEVIDQLKGDEAQQQAAAEAQQQALAIEAQKKQIEMQQGMADIADTEASVELKRSQVGLNQTKTAAELVDIEQTQLETTRAALGLENIG